MPMMEISQDELQATISQYPITIVDLSAVWCGPCRTQERNFEELTQQIPGELLAVAKVDVDKNRQLANDYGIQAVPTMLFFVKGKQYSIKGEGGGSTDRLVGVRDVPFLTALINKIKEEEGL